MLRDADRRAPRTCRLGRARPHPDLARAASPSRSCSIRAANARRPAAAAATGQLPGRQHPVVLTLEEIAAAAGPDRWFQLYVQPPATRPSTCVRRAEAAGYGAIVLTRRCAGPGAEPHAPCAPGSAADCAAANLRPIRAAEPAGWSPGESRIFQGLMRHAPAGTTCEWLRRPDHACRSGSRACMHPDDARACRERGVDGLVVSNHGGRALDGAPASLTRACRAIRAAVGRRRPAAVRRRRPLGQDVFKAMALGADAVLVGRLQAYALAVAGRARRRTYDQAAARGAGDLHGARRLCDAWPTFAQADWARRRSSTGARSMLMPIEACWARTRSARFRGALDAAEWQDGAAIGGRAGPHARRRNLQLDEDDRRRPSPWARTSCASSARNPLFISAALPSKIYPPRFNRYADGGTYGAHVDSALMRHPGGDETLRSDLSATLFLSEPEEYDGGELEIEGAFGVQSVKLRGRRPGALSVQQPAPGDARDPRGPRSRPSSGSRASSRDEAPAHPAVRPRPGDPGR